MEMEIKKVSERKFLRKLRDLDYDSRDYFYDIIVKMPKEIDRFEYGHVPGRRIYRIVLKSGKQIELEVVRRKN